MAGRNGGPDTGCRTRRANDVRADWRDASVKPSRRAGVQSRSQRHALGKAEAGVGPIALTGGFRALSFPIPRLSRRWHLACGGKSKRASAMTHKAITLKFVVPTAVGLGIILSIGPVNRKDKTCQTSQS